MSSNSISIFLGAKFKTLLIHELYWRSQHSMGQGPGGQKFVTLVQFHKLSMFPSFIVSDANYDSLTCNSNPVLIWPLSRCNEDPDCRNPCGFRIANKDAWHVTVPDSLSTTENRQNVTFLTGYNSRTV